MLRAHRPKVAWVLVVAACAVLAVLSAAGQAMAHATLTTTQPQGDAVLASAPERVSLEFTEPVETAFGAIQVYDSDRRPIEVGDLTSPQADTVAVALPDGLADGTYAVSWHVVSADGHPISGAFVFHVGAPEAGAAGLGDQVLEESGATAAGVVAGVVRGIAFGLVLAVIGLAVGLVLVLHDVADGLRRRLLALLAALAGALSVASLGQVALQGATASGLGLGAVVRPEVLGEVLQTRFGQAWLAAAILSAGLAALAAGACLRGRPLRGMLGVGAAVIALWLACCPALAGHAGTSGALALIADAVHVGAGGIWTGGLAALLLALGLSRGARWDLATRAVPRFSSVAVVAVAAVILAGTVNSWMLLGPVSDLWETGYGRLLLVKVALVAPLLALGAVNNRWAVPRLRAGIASPGVRRRFVSLAGSELALVAVVVGITAALVAQPPAETARAAAPPSGPYATEVALGPLTLDVVVRPAVAGDNEIVLHITDPTGMPARVAELDVQAQTAGIAPLRLTPERLGTGYFRIPSASLAFPGDWTLRVEARRGEFEALTQSVSIPIREEQ